jgi:uncharacterized membrane protein
MSQNFLSRLNQLEAHHRLAISTVTAVIAFFLATRFSLAARLIITWDAYAVSLLALAWTRILTAKPRELIRLASLQHTSRMLIFGFIIAAACASFGAVGYLLISAKGLSKEPFASHILAAIGTVTLSWLVMHTIFTLHYAFLYYCHPDLEQKGGALQFPDGDQLEPDYQDFAYFSFVIGMTSQVSDVQIACRQFRRWVLLHGMISFAFNAAILGLSINVLSGLF